MGLLLLKTYSSLNMGLNTICFFSSGTTLFDFCFKSELNLQLIIYKLKSYSYLDHGHMLLKYILNLIQFLISNLTWDQSIEKKKTSFKSETFCRISCFWILPTTLFTPVAGPKKYTSALYFNQPICLDLPKERCCLLPPQLWLCCCELLWPVRVRAGGT